MNNKLGIYIKNAREKIGISQRELARIINVDNKTINNIERGFTKKIAFNILIKLSETLKLSIIKLGKMANYTQEEINKEIFSNILSNSNIFDSYLININLDTDNLIIDKYLYSDDELNEKNIDVGKVLDGYKNNELTKKETLILIKACKPIEYEENKLIYKTEQENIEIDLQ